MANILFLVPIDEAHIWEYQAKEHKVKITRLLPMMVMSVADEKAILKLEKALEDSEHKIWAYVS